MSIAFGGGKRSFAKFTWTETELPDVDGKEQDSEQCAICIDALDGDTTATIPCGHVFHTACRTRYLRSRRPADWECPLCKEQMFVGNAERARLREAAAGGPAAAAEEEEEEEDEDANIVVDASFLGRDSIDVAPGHYSMITRQRLSIEYHTSVARTVGELWGRMLTEWFVDTVPLSELHGCALYRVVFTEDGSLGHCHVRNTLEDEGFRDGDVFTVLQGQNAVLIFDYDVFKQDGVTRFSPWKIWTSYTDTGTDIV